MIQDIEPHSFSGCFTANLSIDASHYVFYFRENTLLLKKTELGYEIPRKTDFAGFAENTDAIFLFAFNGVPCFMVSQLLVFDDTIFEFHEINFFRTIAQNEITWVSIVAFQLKTWYEQNKFCGRCGSPMVHKTDERAVICPTCELTEYPKISPAIIVAIIQNDKILLANNANFRANWYSLVAGYVDIGETLEGTVKREVKEEVGINVHNIRYFKSQPWPYSGSMMIGFFAEADETQTILVDNKEITQAAWFTRGNLPNHPTTFSIAGEMIEKFENGEY